jgi:hypothetical protein
MSDSSSTPLNPEPAPPSGALPLEELTLTPEWVKAPAPSFQRYQDDDRRPRERDRDRDRGRDRRPNRPQGPPREHSMKPGAPRPKPAIGSPRRERFPGKPQRKGPPQPPAKPAPFEPPVDVAFLPDDKAFASICDTMRQSPRAYAFFDVAKLVLNKPERHLVKLSRRPAADGSRAPLYFVAAHANVFLSAHEALRWLLRRHPETIVEEVKTPIDPPKGNFQFVNRCGLTGEILGPPNYHEYPSRLVRHHQQRLAHVPFEKFRAQIETLRDPDAVKAWVDSMSAKAEFKCRLDGAEPVAFATREELERHISAQHLDQLVTAVADVTLAGTASRHLEQAGVLESVRLAWMAERRFPLKTANAMQGRLREQGFHFFKNHKGITFVSTIKLKRFETGQSVTDHVRRIVDFLRAHPNCTRKQLALGLTGTPNSAVPTPAAGSDDALLADLHWLIQDGYVVEMFDGRLWIPDEKAPKPPAVPTPSAPATEPTAEPAPALAGAAESTESPAATAEEPPLSPS